MEIIDKDRSSGDQASGSQHLDEAFNKETRQLVMQVLGECTGLREESGEESEALSTMKRIVRSLLEKYGNVYDGIIEKLPVDDGDKVMHMSAAAHIMFADGTTNWGRIVGLVAFGVVLSRHLNTKEEERRLDLVESVGEAISVCLLTYHKNWLLKSNSWDGFVKFFAKPQHVLRDTHFLFYFFVGFAGIGMLSLWDMFLSFPM